MNEKGNMVIGVVIALLVGALGGYVLGNNKSPAASKDSASMQPTSGLAASATAEEKIANAISAAPTEIGKDATVLDWPAAEGKDFASLRAGTNGWTCLPDDVTTPSNDPLCVDAQAMEWFQAYMTHTKPNLAQAGLGYMLQGGGSPSNTDPYAKAPGEGAMWMQEPPHVMIFTTTPPDSKVYGTNPDLGGPWVMWAGTPYAHLMIPVK